MNFDVTVATSEDYISEQELEDACDIEELKKKAKYEHEHRIPHPTVLGVGTFPTEEQQARCDLLEDDARSTLFCNSMLNGFELLLNSLDMADPKLAKSLRKDVLETAKRTELDDLKFVLDLYFKVQKMRMGLANQLRELTAEMPTLNGDWRPEIPHSCLWLEFQVLYSLEKMTGDIIKRVVHKNKIWEWAKHIKGVGETLVARFLVHLTVREVPTPGRRKVEGKWEDVILKPCGLTAGSWWKYCGLTPDQHRKKGVRINWQPELKQACFLLTDQFIKHKNKGKDKDGNKLPDMSENAYYSRLFNRSLMYEVERNEQGLLKEEADKALANNRFTDAKTIAIYKSGKLPNAHLISRARRRTAKIFLSHLHYVYFQTYLGKKPPKPFAIEQLGHAHEELVPCWDYENEKPRAALY